MAQRRVPACRDERIPARAPDGRFNSGLLRGDTFSVTFYKDEYYEDVHYRYYCMIHPWRTGFIVVY